nr:hypothetical protein [Deltaproteobacteria bacterium]
MSTATEAPALPPPIATAASAEPREWEALVLAIGQPAIKGKVCGLTLRERGRRLCVKAGATRIEIAESPEAAAAFSPTPGRDLLILRVSDQIVHFPLIECVKDVASDRPRIAVSPDGVYGGAIWIPAGAGLCDGAPRGDAAAALAMLGKVDGDS